MLPPSVRRKAEAAGAVEWLDDLPALVASLERDWSIVAGRPLSGGTEAYVVEATLGDGSPGVLKLAIPLGDGALRNEITALRLAGGDGCARLLRDDEERAALLLERLGPPMDQLGLSLRRRHEALCSAAARMWRPAPGCGLPTGAEKGRWLIGYIMTAWEQLDRPCSEPAVDYAVACAERRIAAHDDQRSVLVHGDVHQWNALQADEGFKLVDPDGLLAEPEYDMGILMREDPADLLEGGARDRAHWLAERTGLDATAIWEWGIVERVSTGLLGTSVDLQPGARQMLAVADRVSPR